MHCESDGTLDITVVIAAFQAGGMVGDAVASALSQLPKPREVIVVDDGSTDQTAADAREAGARVIRLDENAGPGAARAAGTRQASTEWVAWLDADDQFYPGHLARLWAARDSHVLVADAAQGTASGTLFGWCGPRQRTLTKPGQFLFPENPIVLSAAMARREALLSLGGFCSGRHSEDLETWIGLSLIGSARVIPEVGVAYREHEQQVSRANPLMAPSVLSILERHENSAWFRRRYVRAVEARIAWDEDRPSALKHPSSWAYIVRLLAYRRMGHIRRSLGHIAPV